MRSALGDHLGWRPPRLLVTLVSVSRVSAARPSEALTTSSDPSGQRMVSRLGRSPVGVREFAERVADHTVDGVQVQVAVVVQVPELRRPAPAGGGDS